MSAITVSFSAGLQAWNLVIRSVFVNQRVQTSLQRPTESIDLLPMHLTVFSPSCLVVLAMTLKGIELWFAPL